MLVRLLKIAAMMDLLKVIHASKYVEPLNNTTNTTTTTTTTNNNKSYQLLSACLRQRYQQQSSASQTLHVVIRADKRDPPVDKLKLISASHEHNLNVIDA